MEKVAVKNAADEKQVKAAADKELRGQELAAQDLKNVLATESGRRFVWRLLGHCRVFETIWHNSALIHYNSGMQDVGHWLLKEINDCDTEGLLKMMKENKGDK
jgi:hypothetical protein